MNSTNKRRVILLLASCMIATLFFGLFNKYYNDQVKRVELNITVKSDKVDEYSVYYDIEGDNKWSEDRVIKQAYTKTGSKEELGFGIPMDAKNIRVDLGNSPTEIYIDNIYFKANGKKVELNKEELNKLQTSINEIRVNDDNNISSLGNDPYIVLSNVTSIFESIGGRPGYLNVLMVVGSILLGAIMANSLTNFKNSARFVVDCYRNRELVMKLAKNDFKTRYASSYLGIIWGFIQPLVTIMVYWFVFQVGFRSGDVGDAPFILWFIAGIIPWFFFSDGLSSTTNVFIEYSYLVKKVVFKIEVLPTVKITSALFVHGFFIIFIFIIMTAYGYYPSVHSLQFIYYSFCMVVLVYSVSFFTSAVVLFFRDLNQIITIIINVGFWATPIGWNIEMLPEFWGRLFKLNPMYYIVTGYRDSFIERIFIWQRPYETIYFWCFCLVTLLLGVKMFKKLKPHFSDVL
ncbi:MAG: ABC transporter permease [Clostridium sp.]